jgi:hypothetical protein
MNDTDLREFGYAPGGYASNCMDCDLPMMFVDKRCRVCRDCAIKRRAGKLEKQRNCKHEHTLPPNRWDVHGMCMECGKSI